MLRFKPRHKPLTTPDKSDKSAYKNLPGYKKLMVGHETLAYEVVFSRRKTLSVYIYPDSTVKVRAPRYCTYKEIESFLAQRFQWIQDQLDKFSGNKPVVRLSYIEGEEHLYLGCYYPIVVQPARPQHVAMIESRIVIKTFDTDNPERVKKLLTDWYRKQALELFYERLVVCYERMKHLGIDLPELKIRNMKRQWGNCSSGGVVCLNLWLIKAPLICVDYVIIHELSHLLEFNHSPRFYAIMDSVMPNWKAVKRQLDQGRYACDYL